MIRLLPHPKPKTGRIRIFKHLNSGLLICEYNHKWLLVNTIINPADSSPDASEAPADAAVDTAISEDDAAAPAEAAADDGARRRPRGQGFEREQREREGQPEHASASPDGKRTGAADATPAARGV